MKEDNVNNNNVNNNKENMVKAELKEQNIENVVERKSFQNDLSEKSETLENYSNIENVVNKQDLLTEKHELFETEINKESDKDKDKDNDNDKGDFIESTLENENEINNEESKEFAQISGRKRFVKVVALAAAAVFGVQIIVGGLVFVGLSSSNPDLVQRVGSAISGNSYSNGMYATTVSTDKGMIRNIVVEKSNSPIVAIAEKVGPSVVGIRVTAKTANSWFGASTSNPEGSGIIIRSDGYIMTNNHVIEDALAQGANKINNGSKIEVILPSQKDKPYNATIVGRDTRTDLAVIRIEANDLPAVEIGNSDQIKVGELVVAIGNPGGLEYMGSVTAGIVSGLNRTIPVEDGKELKLIQTDAAINPGNSGGALVNGSGQLIGINTAKIGGQGFEGLGFAIPVNKAKEITDSLMEFKYVKGRPLFGIVADPRYTEELAQSYGMPAGVLVSEVTPFTGAETAGIKPKDIITKISGKVVKSVDELNLVKKNNKPGDTIDVEIYRNEAYQNLKVKLTEDKR